MHQRAAFTCVCTDVVWPTLPEADGFLVVSVKTPVVECAETVLTTTVL